MKFAALCALVLMAGCSESGNIVEDWGPSAGYATVTGTVRHADGTPVMNTLLGLGRCSSPLVGGTDPRLTDGQGGYRVRIGLPPVGLTLVRADTLRVTCGYFLALGSTPVDSVTLRFAADTIGLVAQVHDVTIP